MEQQIIEKVVAEKNAESVRLVEKRVRQLVDEIVALESEINYAAERIIKAKQELRDLQMPKPVVL